MVLNELFRNVDTMHERVKGPFHHFPQSFLSPLNSAPGSVVQKLESLLLSEPQHGSWAEVSGHALTPAGGR